MRVRAVAIAGLAALALAAPAQADTWTVTDGSSDATSPDCDVKTHECLSLRLAIAASEATKEVADVINVPAGVIHINNDLVIQSDITINGVSARTNIIDGGAKYRGLRVTTSGIAKLNHFTIRNGAAGQGQSTNGGGVLNQGQAALDTVRVTGSRATNGGGIANLQNAVLSLQSVLLDGNTAEDDGGGIFNQGGPEPTPLTYVMMRDSTVFGNAAGAGGGGGIASRNAGSLLDVGRSTIADNTAGDRGAGLIVRAQRASLTATIVARNRVGSATVNCGPDAPVDGGANVEDEKQCGFSLGSVNPQLETKLANQGGELDVLPIGASSPAVDRLAQGDACKPPLFDQRGLYRPQGPACDAGAYELDQAATMTITSGPSGTVASGDVEFTFSSSEPGVNPVCQLTGPGQAGGFVACYKVNAQPYTGLANGSYTFSVRDGAFPTGPLASRTFTVAGLDTTITGGPGGPTNDSTPTFTFTGTSASGFQCRVDTATFASCSSPFTAAPLADGQHTFEVRALGASGAPDPTPASRTFTVDTVAPNTSIVTGPSGTVASTTATFTFSSTESGSTFQCSLDGAAFTACPAGYTGLSQGAHTFSVRASDAAGNTDATPATRTWTVDTVAPDTSVAPIGTPTNDSTPTFTFTATEAGSTFECRVDTASFAPCTSPHTTASLTDGTHTFAVRATDPAGNTDGTPATQTFVIDTSTPDTTITGGPGAATNDTTPTFTFTGANGAAQFQCSVDGSEFTTCSSPFTTGVLAAGSHTVSIRALNGAGTPDPSPATRTFVVDLTPPDTTITAGPPSPSNDTTPTFSFGSTEAGSTFECRVDTASFASCTSPHTTAALTGGNHTFEVRAIDPAGNTDTSAAARSFTIDTTPPNTSLTLVASPTNDATPTWTFSSEAGARFECRIGGGGYTSCTSPFTSPALADGSHTFEVRAIDTAGNADPTPAAQTFAVDTVAPSTTITSGPAERDSDTTPTFRFTSSEAGSTFQCRVDAAFATCTSPHTTAALADGDHTFQVRAIDAAGNMDANGASFAFTIDTTTPETMIVSGPDGPTGNATPTFTFSGDNGATAFQCRIDGGEFTSCSSPLTLPALPDGAHTFAVRASNTIGTFDPTPAIRAFTVDTTPPAEPVVTGGPEGPTTDGSPAFTFTAGETVSCRLDGPDGATGTFAACASPKPFSALAPGAYVFMVRSVDAAGNERTAIRAFTVTVPQQATPTPTPTSTPIATPTPTPTATPVAGRSVDARPAGGTVLIKLPGAKTFVPLDPSVIRVGAEIDARKGRVELTRADGGRATFYQGIFKLSESGGYTTLTLTEKLTGCPKHKRARKSASAAAKKKKPKTRKLWGSGKGRFRTKGQYSAATVRGTRWLVQDTCTTTVTRVTQGVVAVRDNVKRKTVVLKKGKRYTARAKQRKR